MASMDSEIKNTISHRAIAAKSFLNELEKIYS
jgi:inosine/xanthosine triphosphate pyrophosphatase family protein